MTHFDLSTRSFVPASWSIRDETHHDRPHHLIVRHGNVSCHGGFVEIYSSRSWRDGDKYFGEFTCLEMVAGDTLFSARLEKFYTKRYLVTLAKRFAAQVAAEAAEVAA